MTTKHVNLRLAPAMHSRILAVAERNHRSLNGEIEQAIDEHLRREDMRGKEISRIDGGDPRNSDPSGLEIREQ